MASVFLKIYGLERSGTNYLAWVLGRAFVEVSVLVDETGWKHGPITRPVDWTGYDWSDPNWSATSKFRHAQQRIERLGKRCDLLKAIVEESLLPILIITKNPIFWLYSYAKYKGELCSPLKADYLDRWININRSYFEFFQNNEGNCCIIRYEDFVCSPLQSIEGIRSKFGLIRTQRQHFRLLQSLTRTGRRSRRPFDLSVSVSKSYLTHFSDNDLALARERLDSDILECLGYGAV